MLLDSLFRFNQTLRSHIWNKHQLVIRILRYLSIFISLTVLGCILYLVGFSQTSQTFRWIHSYITFSLYFYVIKYLIQMFYTLHKVYYIKHSWMESLIVFSLILNYILSHFFEISFSRMIIEKFGISWVDNLYIVFIQCYFFIFSISEILGGNSLIRKYKISPSVLMIFSFLFLIFGGTFFLLLPEMTTDGISFIDALFTAASASCVTGLTVVETAAAFTLKGKIVILFLIQLGGMSALLFTTFFVSFLSHSFSGLKYQSLMNDIVSSNKLSETKVLFRQICTFSIIIELIGMSLLYIYWDYTEVFNSKMENLFYSIFHTVSAFNNAGFVLFTDNLYNVAIVDNYISQLILMILIILGGLGFLCLRDFLDVSLVKERWRYRWRKIHPSTKVAVLMTFIIISTATILFFMIEYRHGLFEEKSIGSKIYASLFMVVNSRTAGFGLLDMDALRLPSLLLLILVMYIGASPGSTGGGIKTTTLFVLLKSASATIKNKKQIAFDKHSIPFSIADRAYAIVLFSVALIFVSVFLMTIFEPDKYLSDIVFETVSAFSTTGLSTGITANLSVCSKWIIIFNMFIGRVGTITIAVALSRKRYYTNYSYANTFIMVG